MVDSKPVYIALGESRAGPSVVRGPFRERSDAQDAREELVDRADLSGSRILERAVV